MIYFDHAASTYCPLGVQHAMAEATHEYGNVHRGLHRYAEATTERYEGARAKVAEFIGADPTEIAFTHGTTESINLVARGLENYVKAGDEIIVTVAEHHSNLVPWQALAKRRGAQVRVLPLSLTGKFSDAAFHFALNGRTKIVAFPVASNVLGTRFPVAKIVSQAHEAGALVVADAAQSIAHFPHNVKSMGVDFMAFSGHKMYGPTGVGVLYIRDELIDQMEPTYYGGGMDLEVTETDFAYPVASRMFEAGTPPILQAIGLGAAVDYVSGRWLPRIQQEQELIRHAHTKLTANGLTILGPGPADRVPLISFNLPDIHPHDVATLLDRRGIAVRAGYHCATPLHQRLGLNGTVRASFNFENTKDQIDEMVAVLKRIHTSFPR